MNLDLKRPDGVEADDSDFDGMLESIKTGDEQMGNREFTDAEETFKGVIETARGYYGAMNPVLLPLWVKLGEAQLADCADEDHFEDLTRTWQRVLALAQLEHGPESTDLAPYISKLIAVYDLQGSHILSAELLQRLQMLNEANQGK